MLTNILSIGPIGTNQCWLKGSRASPCDLANRIRITEAIQLFLLASSRMSESNFRPLCPACLGVCLRELISRSDMDNAHHRRITWWSSWIRIIITVLLRIDKVVIALHRRIKTGNILQEKPILHVNFDTQQFLPFLLHMAPVCNTCNGNDGCKVKSTWHPPSPALPPALTPADHGCSCFWGRTELLYIPYHYCWKQPYGTE